MSKSEILGLIDFLSNIENLVLFDMAIFVDYSLKDKIPFLKYLCEFHHFEIQPFFKLHKWCTCQMLGLQIFMILFVVNIYKNLQRYDMFLLFLMNFDSQPLFTVL